MVSFAKARASWIFDWDIYTSNNPWRESKSGLRVNASWNAWIDSVLFTLKSNAPFNKNEFACVGFNFIAFFLKIQNKL